MSDTNFNRLGLNAAQTLATMLSQVSLPIAMIAGLALLVVRAHATENQIDKLSVG